MQTMQRIPRKMRPGRSRAAARSTDQPRELFHDPAIRAARLAAQAQAETITRDNPEEA